jgi:hypothetical protein
MAEYGLVAGMGFDDLFDSDEEEDDDSDGMGDDDSDER